MKPTGVLILALSASAVLLAQSDRDAMAQRISVLMQQYAADTSPSKPDPAVTLWTVGDGSVHSILNLGAAVLDYSLDRASGLSAVVGYGESSGSGWKGYWDIVCKSCCPGVDWWDRGALSVASDGSAGAMDSNTKRMDPQACQLTSDPDTVTINYRRVLGLRFKEILPGKLISIVAAPAVGSQSSQYKAAVTAAWNLANTGVDHVTIVVEGQKTNGGAVGEFPFVTARPGVYHFLLVGYSKTNQPIDLERLAIEIPNIPGIN